MCYNKIIGEIKMKIYKEYKLKNGEILIIRSAEKVDAQEELNMYKQQTSETPFLSRGAGDIFPTVEDFAENYEYYLEDDRNCYLVAVYNGKIIGSAHLDYCSNKKRSKHKCDIDLGVLKDYWGLGVGGRLMQTLIDVAEKSNFEQVELCVASKNERAIKMYESFGFERFGIMPRAMKYEDGTYMDMLSMVKFLQKEYIKE